MTAANTAIPPTTTTQATVTVSTIGATAACATPVTSISPSGTTLAPKLTTASEKRTRSKSATGRPKYYAIAVGTIPGVYDSWDTARTMVEGIKGASHRSFATKAEAYAWLSLRDTRVTTQDDGTSAGVGTATAASSVRAGSGAVGSSRHADADRPASFPLQSLASSSTTAATIAVSGTATISAMTNLSKGFPPLNSPTSDIAAGVNRNDGRARNAADTAVGGQSGSRAASNGQTFPVQPPAPLANCTADSPTAAKASSAAAAAAAGMPVDH